MTDPCAICYEAISASSGHVTMGCSHTFHFRCLSGWFVEQVAKGQSETCPCCRREGGELETLALPPAAEEDDDESYEDEDEEDEDFYYLIRFELDEALKSLGAAGCSSAMWKHVFPGTDEEYREDSAVSFSRSEIENFAILQGGRAFTEEEWTAFAGRFDSEEAVEAMAAEAAAAAQPVVEGAAAVLAAEAAGGAGPAVPPLQLNITWAQRPDGSWERVVNAPPGAPAWGAANPEPPPDDLVSVTTEAAKKVQAVWRGWQARRRFRLPA
jgi:hypothetical protein